MRSPPGWIKRRQSYGLLIVSVGKGFIRVPIPQGLATVRCLPTWFSCNRCPVAMLASIVLPATVTGRAAGGLVIGSDRRWRRVFGCWAFARQWRNTQLKLPFGRCRDTRCPHSSRCRPFPWSRANVGPIAQRRAGQTAPAQGRTHPGKIAGDSRRRPRQHARNLLPTLPRSCRSKPQVVQPWLQPARPASAVADQRDHRNAHPQGIQRGGVTVVRNGIQAEIDAPIVGQVLGTRRSIHEFQAARRDAAASELISLTTFCRCAP